MKQSSILYENASQTVFLVDIPTSITLAQELSRTQQLRSPESSSTTTTTSTKKRHLLSTLPLREPYPSPPEPKTNAARARLLGRVTLVEREYHANLIAPVRDGLDEIRGCYDQGWCLERVTVDAGEESRKRSFEDVHDHDDYGHGHGHEADGPQPPVILSSTSPNHFRSMTELSNAIVKNPSQQSASLVTPGEFPEKPRIFTIPALSNFLHCTLSTTQPNPARHLIPGLPQSHKFNLILLDPPWPNRSVCRSRHYNTQAYFDMNSLSRYIRDILRMHLLNPSFYPPPETETQKQSKECIAAIWITNAEKPRKAAYDAIHDAGLLVCEEWVWVKTTSSGEPIMPVEGLWRKPYEVLVIGKRRDGFEGGDWDGEFVRRVIAAVPDVHSRKPNLREVLEKGFFGDWGYEALEVFARNLTAGWWGVGNEVLKFNEEEWWASE